MINCNWCKDTGKVKLLFSEVECTECNRKQSTPKKCDEDINWGNSTIKNFNDVVFRNQIITGNSLSEIIFSINNYKPLATYIIGFLFNDPIKEAKFEISEIKINDISQQIPKYPSSYNYPTPVNWNQIDSKISLQIKNMEKEKIIVYMVLWGKYL